ncbi:hypothetical protein V469_18505 [Aeromonas hydrophila J-1]|nr:hypothetical protein V469_18505 [Aeromonas hydrophila J-1]
MYSRLITPERIHRWGDEDLLEATEQDRARIVQAAPVRRLQQKTQVFPLDVKASVRSRLTHSLEVQETGRQISRRILAALPAGSVCEGAFINLVEMSCLLHDVGNPPFGHFGEQVMSQWLAQALDGLFAEALGSAPSSQWATLRQDLLVFDGNAQSLRLVHSLHELNLTLGQLAALCKYPQQPLHGGQHHGWASKRGIFFSEQPLYRALGQSLGLAPGCRHPLVYIMEAADDISYCIADLEDAVDRRILSLSELQQALRLADDGAYMAGLLAEAAKSQLDDYLSELGEGVKETWLERGFSEDLLPGIRRLSLPATAQTQDIVQLVCRQEEKLIGELSHLARECPTEETVRLLGGLAEQEQTRLTRLVHGAHRLDDL